MSELGAFTGRTGRQVSKKENTLPRCADLVDCGYDNRDSDLFCRACALPLLYTALAGRYVVEALISKGGYPAVFRGVDQNLSRRIAIKVLLPSKTTPSEQEHFLREARISATLDHPNLAPILDYGKDGPSVFLVMPLYTAGSLRTRLARANGPLPASETLMNFRQLVNALHYAMLTGYHPFDSMGGGPVMPPSSLNHELPTAIDAVVQRALAPRPDGRFSDMLEFLHLFEAAARPSGGMRLTPPGSTLDSRNAPAGRRVTNPSTPAVPLAGDKGDSSGRQQAVRPNTTGAREKCQEGDALLKQQQYGQALQAYEDALRMDARNFHAWNGKGTALYSQGNYRKAYDAYQKATEIEPDNPVVWVSTGLALNRLQRYPQALVHFERALTLDPGYVAAWNGKADAQLDMNMPEDAITSYSQALVYEPQSFQAWNGLGNARSYLRDYAGAVEAYSHALIVNPRSAVAWCNKAEALIHYGHNRSALDALNEATELDRSYARAWTLKADVHESLGNHQEAQKARKRARPWGLVN